MRTACDDKLTPEHLPLMSLLVLLSFIIPPTLFAFLVPVVEPGQEGGTAGENLQ